MTLSHLINGALETVGGLSGQALRAATDRGWVYFPYASQALSQIPFSLGWKLRRAIYARSMTGGVGEGTTIHHGVVFDDHRSTIGREVWISAGVYIELCELEDYVMIGPRAVLLTAGSYHRFDRTDVPIKLQGNGERRPLRIGRGAWIGANATVMANVGHDAIVSAGSLVTRPVPPYAIVGGNPAQILRMRQPPPSGVQNGNGPAARTSLQP